MKNKIAFLFTGLFILLLTIGFARACGPSILKVELKSNITWSENVTYTNSNICIKNITEMSECPNQNESDAEICQIANVTKCLEYKIEKLEERFSCSKITFSYYQSLNQSFVLSRLNSAKNHCGLSSEDVDILKDYIVNGYNVKEQTDEEYAVFLEEAIQTNKGYKKCGDSEYAAISHRGKYTGYVLVVREGCITKLCGGNIPANLLWNDLLPVVNNTGDNDSYFYLFYIAISIVLLIVIYALYRVLRR